MKAPLIISVMILSACAGPKTEVPVTPAAIIPAAYTYKTASGSSALFPSTDDGLLHIGQIFEWSIKESQAEVGKVDVVWGANQSGAVRRGKYFAFGMYSIDESPTQFIAAYPSWIEYQCDRVTQAKFADSSQYVVALDFSNPDVQQFIFDNAFEAALADGFDIDLDNTLALNTTRACGHYTETGQWIQQYSGAADDESYNQAVISATTTWARMIHRFSDQRALVIDTQATPENLSDTIELGKAADMVLDETGVTQWGWITPDVWNAQNTLALTLAAAGKCIWFIDDENPGQAPLVPTAAQRLYDVANYYLTKGACSYVTINAPPGYGYLLPYPTSETSMDLGMPLDAATKQPNSSWVRHFEKGAVTVNPYNQTASIQ